MFYFKYDPKILRAPNLDPKKREDLLSEMRDLIDNFLVEILEEQGYPKDFSEFTGKPEMESFLDNIRSIFRTESENQVQKQSTRAGLQRAESVEEDVASLMSSVRYFVSQLLILNVFLPSIQGMAKMERRRQKRLKSWSLERAMSLARL